jgi:hypothetical protein
VADRSAPIRAAPDESSIQPAAEASESVPTPADLAAAHRVREPAPSLDYPPGQTARPEPFTATSPVADLDDEAAPGDREAERGLRGLVGSGSSQVSVSAACRARDAARPTDEDLARAERELTIVRRNWVPREPFRPGGRR